MTWVALYLAVVLGAIFGWALATMMHIAKRSDRDRELDEMYDYYTRKRDKDDALQ